jgi:hypothetical protein
VGEAAPSVRDGRGGGRGRREDVRPPLARERSGEAKGMVSSACASARRRKWAYICSHNPLVYGPAFPKFDRSTDICAGSGPVRPKSDELSYYLTDPNTFSWTRTNPTLADARTGKNKTAKNVGASLRPALHLPMRAGTSHTRCRQIPLAHGSDQVRSVPVRARCS